MRGLLQRKCDLRIHLRIFHGLFIRDRIHPVTIKCRGTCGIIFCTSVFHEKNRLTVKCQKYIHLSVVDVTTLVWSRVVVIHFFLLVDHVFDLCWIGYNYVPTGGVVISEFGHCDGQHYKVMEYGVPRCVIIHKVSDGCCCCWVVLYPYENLVSVSTS